MSLTKCQMSFAKCRMSLTKCQMSLTKCQMSLTKCQMSLTKCQMSLTKCQMSEDAPSYDKVGDGGEFLPKGDPRYANISKASWHRGWDADDGDER
eukprot:gene10141-6002_t